MRCKFNKHQCLHVKSLHLLRKHRMAIAKAVTCVFSKKLCTVSIIVLFTLVTIIHYNIYIVQMFYVPKLGYSNCNWMKPKTKKLQNHEAPPWFSLLADYGDAIRSGKNLYVWPRYASKMRLGNKLFNYAATFGIAWQNRRIPVWPRNKLSGKHDITTFFNLRVPSGRRNAIIGVSFIYYWISEHLN